MLIGVSGRISSGKDTVGEIVQILTNSPHFTDEAVLDFIGRPHLNPKWEIRRFADKLKDIVCMLLGCTREQLEGREFKEKELGEEWWYWKIFGYNGANSNGNFILIPYDNSEPNKYDKIALIKPTPRLFMQLLGTEAGRQIIHPNIWCNSLMSEYKPLDSYQGVLWHVSSEQMEKISKSVEAEYPNWIITDMRFPNELKAVEDRNGITIRVNRPCNICGGSGYHKMSCPVSKSGEHCSETALDNAEFDYTIDNNGTLLELVGKVREILTKENII